MTAKVFISHSANDKIEAGRIVADIEKRGIPCWISTRLRDLPPGQDYQTSIVAAMEPASAVVLLFSDSANNSKEIPKEMALASQLHKPIIPAKIENSEPRGAFKYQMAAAQFINLYEDYANRIDELCARLAELGEAGGSAPSMPHRNQASSRGRWRLSGALVAGVIAAAVGGIGWTQQARLHAMFAPNTAAITAAPVVTLAPAKTTAVNAQPVIAPAAVPVQAAQPAKAAVEQPAVAPVPAPPMASPAVANVPVSPPPAAEVGYTAINNTALRATADPYGETVEMIQVGDTVQATPNDQTDPAWVHVITQDGQTGYVSRADLASQ